MTKRVFKNLIKKLADSNKIEFIFKEFPSRYIAMEQNKCFMLYINLNSSSNVINCSFSYSLAPNHVKDITIMLLLFAHNNDTDISFEDEFYFKKNEIVTGSNAKKAWSLEIEDDITRDYKREKYIDDLWSSYCLDDFVEC